MTRRPAVAGQFYPGNPDRLRAALDELLEPDAPKQPALAILCPHAGYPYSGLTAGKVFSRIEIPSRMVLLGFNHRSIGSPLALFGHGRWQTPLGTVDIDEPLADRILAASPDLENDPQAHAFEHSLEVELPFIQRLRDGVKIVPIIIASHNHMRKLRAAGEAIGQVLRSESEPVLLLASSDLDHYENEEVVQRKDKMAIDAIQALDPDRLMDVCQDESITMCGVAPACVMLVAAKAMGATKAVLIDHSTSGDTTGDYSSVVGYAGMIVS